jgi:hypothetical protein
MKNGSQERSRRRINCPNFTSFLLNPFVEAHGEMSRPPVLLSVQFSGLDVLTPCTGKHHLTPDELAQLSPGGLLQACLHYRSLLQVILGILTAAQETLTLRIVAADLVYQQA